MATLILIIILSIFSAPSNSWQIVYEDQAGNNHEATIGAVTAGDALFVFEKQYGDQFITCVARRDRNSCRRSTGQ